MKAKETLGASEPITSLREEYKGNPEWLPKIEALCKAYPRLRRIRGDGSCFYRAYLFCVWLQVASGGAAAAKSLVTRLEPRYTSLVKDLGYPEFTCEDFWETFREEIVRAGAVSAGGGSAASNGEGGNGDGAGGAAADGGEAAAAAATTAAATAKGGGTEGGGGKTDGASAANTEKTVADMFRDEGDGVGNYLITFARLLVSHELKTRPDEYQPFLWANPELGADIPSFCRNQVEPVDVEAGEIQAAALVAAMGVPLRVEYLDRVGGSTIDFPNGAGQPKVGAVLLFRPGHYDVLFVE